MRLLLAKACVAIFALVLMAFPKKAMSASLDCVQLPTAFNFFQCNLSAVGPPANASWSVTPNHGTLIETPAKKLTERFFQCEAVDDIIDDMGNVIQDTRDGTVTVNYVFLPNFPLDLSQSDDVRCRSPGGMMMASSCRIEFSFCLGSDAQILNHFTSSAVGFGVAQLKTGGSFWNTIGSAFGGACLPGSAPQGATTDYRVIDSLGNQLCTDSITIGIGECSGSGGGPGPL